MPFRLGEFLVEPRLNRLTRNGDAIQIELKLIDVLVCLARRACDLAERQQLFDTVRHTGFISEHSSPRPSRIFETLAASQLHRRKHR